MYLDDIMEHRYQYKVFNDNVGTVVTMLFENEEYAKKFAKRCLIDFYEHQEHELEDLKVEFICKFKQESFINLNLL